MKERSKIQWYGDVLGADGKAQPPMIAPDVEHHLEGLNRGEFYICDNADDPALFIRTNKDTIVAFRLTADVEELAKIFLRKDQPDATQYLLKLLSGAEFGPYAAGLAGGKIDEQGAAELLTLLLRGALTVGYDVLTGKGTATIGADGAGELESLRLRGDLKSDNFTTGALGAGYALLKKDANGDSYLEVDRMMVRKVATFVQLLIQKIRAVGGQIILSPATMSCSRVEEHDTFYRCYFENTDGAKTIAQEFAAGDQARCQTFNVKEGVSENVSNQYYWRLVTAVGDDYIDLSKTDCDAGSTVPQAGDDIVQLGNRTDAARQSAIVLSAYGNDAPYLKMYRGIDSYELDGREFVNFSRTDIMLIADRLRFSTGESVKDYIDGKTENAVTNVRTEFAIGDSPTTAPATGWSTTSPQWTPGKYVWQRTAITTAKGTTYSNTTCIQGAKGEPGDKGDPGRGVSALEPQYYLSTSNTTQTGGSWQTTCPAWESGKYIWTRTKVTWTDNTVTYTTPVLAEDINDLGAKLEQAISDLAENIDFVNSLSEELETVKDQVDGAIETWFYDHVPTLTNAPASSWTTTELKNQHLGDLYYDGNGKAYRFQMSGNNYVWQVITDTDITKALANAQKAQDTADGKRRVFVTTPTNASAYDVGDLWVNATYGSYSNDLLRCKTAKAAGAAWNISHWEKASKYTDDTKANQAIADAAEALAAANDAQDTANAAKERLDGWAADNVISPTEKQALKDEMARIDGDKSEITAGYTKYGLGTPTAYNDAHSAYRAVLATLSASTPETIAIPADFATKQTAYYTARTNALTAIADAAKAYVDSIEVGARNYIRNTSSECTFLPDGNYNVAYYSSPSWRVVEEAGNIGQCVFACEVIAEGCDFGENGKIMLQTTNENGWPYRSFGAVASNGVHTLTSLPTLNYNVSGETTMSVLNNYVSGGTVTVRRVRLYKGTKDVGWTPAPEDAENALNNYKEEVEAKFEATNESITAAVESSKEYTLEQVDGLQIGGRNMKYDSAKMDKANPLYSTFEKTFVADDSLPTGGYVMLELKSILDSVQSFYGVFLSGFESRQAGKTYTWSIWLKASRPITLLRLGCEEAQGYMQAAITTEWQRFTRTFTVLPIDTLHAFDFYNHKNGSDLRWQPGDIIYAHSLKIEEGTKATSWTPAPEDIQSSIGEVDSALTEFKQSTTSQLSVMQGQINAKVSQTTLTETLANYVTTTTLNQKVSEINQTMDGITSRVSKTETSISGLTTRVTTAESTIEQQAQQIALRVTKDDITSSFTMTAGGISLLGKEISLTGRVTFAMLSADAQGTINGKVDSATIIEGGKIKTSMIDVDNLYVKHLEGATGDFTGEVNADSGKIGRWIIDGYSLKTENNVIPSNPTAGGEGSRLTNGGLQLTCGSEAGSAGILQSASGMAMAASIIAKGTNAGLYGAFIGAEYTGYAGSIANVVALELSAKSTSTNPLGDPPLAIKVDAGFCDFKGIQNLSFGRLNVIAVNAGVSNIDVYAYTYPTTKSGMYIYKPLDYQYVNCIRLIDSTANYVVNICAPPDGDQLIIVANNTNGTKRVCMTRGGNTWYTNIGSYKAKIFYTNGGINYYGGHPVSDLYDLSG